MDDTDIELNPVIGANGMFVGLDFTPLNNAFTVDSQHIMEGTLRYIVDPPPPILDGFGASLDPIGFSRLNVVLLYGTKQPGQVIPDDLQTLTFGAQNDSENPYELNTGVHPVPPSNYLDVSLTITIGNGNEASSSGGGTSTVYSSASLVTPEPAAFGFVGIGLAGLIALGRRRRRR